MIIELRQRLTIDSISVTTNDEYYNITQIPFPAVTIFENYGLMRFSMRPKEADHDHELAQLQLSFVVY